MRILLPYPPGGSADVLARAIAEQITQQGGRTAIVENRAGASGTIGALAAARAAPDGATMLQADGSPMSILLEAGRSAKVCVVRHDARGGLAGIEVQS